MLDPLSKNLIQELELSQQEFFVSLLESNKILDTEKSNFPNNLILEPDGRALVKSTSGKLNAQNIYDVMPVLQEILNLAIQMNRPSWINDNKLLIQRPTIMVESETPAITFRVLDGKPGAAGSGPVNSPSRRMVTPILRGRYVDPTDRSNEIYLYGQRMDYNIALSVYAQTAHEADIIKEWIADVIKTYLWYVRYSGVSDFTFVQEFSDDMESSKQKRTLQYALSIEKLTWSSFFILRDIAIKLTTLS